MFRYVKSTMGIAEKQQLEVTGMQLAELSTKIDALLTYQGLTVREIGDGAYEVIKQQPASGDYLDPIPYKPGDAVTAGLWYYTEDKLLPHEAIVDGVPNGFRDPMYFRYVD